MESQSNLEKTLAYVQQRKTGGKVYVQGIIAVAVFLASVAVVIFVYLPYISSTQELVTRRKTLETDVEALQKKYDTISGYDQTELASGLTTAAKYIPDDIKVAQLATFINQYAKQYNLTVSRLGINEDKSEVKQSASESEKGKLIGTTEANTVLLGRVEGPFSFRGTRENIYKFLDFLVMGGFATNFDQVTLNAGETDSTWSVNLFASYYYLKPVVGVEPSRPLLAVLKDSLKPITVDENNILPTPEVTTTVTPSVTVTPTASTTQSVTAAPSASPTVTQ